MIISVIGNCQGESLAKCLMAMNHGLHADFYMINEIMADPDRLRSAIDKAEHVFAQPGLRPILPSDLVRKVIYFPSIAFSAYHPEIGRAHV